MKNIHVVLVVSGMAVAGLVTGNLVSRHPSDTPASAVQTVKQEPKRNLRNNETPPPSLPKNLPQSNDAQPPMQMQQQKNPKQPVSDERKNVVIHPEDPTFGSNRAKVTIVEFADFQCPYCGRASQTISQIREQYGDKVRLVFKHDPLPFHKDALLAHQAAAEANAQGLFWEYQARLFANQKALSRTDLESYAQTVGLDMAKFRQALDSGVHKNHIDKDLAQASELGASGVPSFYINGKYLSGAQPFEAFKQVIDQELGQ